MAKKAATKAERLYMARAVDLGCALCRALGLGTSPAEYHHARDVAGAGQRSAHTDGFPLCFRHHRGSDEALHVMGTRAWERYFGVTERELRMQTQQLLGVA